jgi:archaemetzincin
MEGAMQSRVLLLVSVGNLPPGLMKEIEEPLQAYLAITCQVGTQPLANPAYAFNKDRQQYHANAIMRRVAPLLEPGHRFAMGVADVDLFVPDSPFVFGETDREAKVAVISAFRLKGASAETVRRRVQVEALHQAGHLLGLSYCEDPRCMMFLALSPADVDHKGMTLCNLCRNELNKLSR